MFYNDRNAAFSIRGIYRERRDAAKSSVYARSFAAIAFRFSGKCVFSAGDTRIEAGKDSVVYLPPHTSFDRDGTEEELIYLHAEVLGKYPDVPDAVVCPDAAWYFLRMEQLWREKEPGYENRCQALLYEVFSVIERFSPLFRRRAAVIEEGLACLRTRFADPTLSVAEAAEVCHISEVYFRRLCRELTGMTPVAYLAARRIEYAEMLLRTEHCTVAEAAERSGFSDVKYFAAVFRKKVGCTPSACRDGDA